MSDFPKFSVVVPTCHRNDLLALCLERIVPGAQSLNAAAYEVIVTDDGSNSTAEAMVRERFPTVRWIQGPRKGPAANRNNGAKASAGAWLVFADDDCLPDATWLEAYAEAISSAPETEVFEGRIYPDGPQRSLAETAPINDRGGFLWSCNFAIQKALFKSLNGFNERFPYAAMEDVDFRSRVIRAGKHFPFIPGASMCHPWRLREPVGEQVRYLQCLAVYLELHPEQAGNFSAAKTLRLHLRHMLKETLPGIWKYRGAGLSIAFLAHYLAVRDSIFRPRFPSR